MKAGWTSKRLEELVEIKLGRTPPRAEKKFWDPTKSTDNTWVSIADLSENEGGVIAESKEHLSKAGADTTPLVKSGTLLVSFKLSLGKVAIAGKDLRTNEAIAAMPIKASGLDVNWLKYFFQFFDWGKATVGEEKVKGKTLNKKKLKEIQIPLPPLAEQKRIVALLDEAFKGIDEAKAKIDKCSENVASILQVFVDENFGSFAETCPPRPLKDVSEYFNGLTYAPQDVSDSGTIVLRSSNVQEGNLDLSDRVRVSARIKDKLYARAGDVLMCSRNGSKRLIGKCTLIPAELPERMTFGTFMMIIRSDIGPFLNLFFKSSRFKAQIASGSATNINQITRGMLDDVELPMPDNTASTAFVTKAAELSGLVNEYVTRLSQKSRLLDEIKSSLLAQAFAGELTA
jgi:type I restriction enzyme, S subunit